MNGLLPLLYRERWWLTAFVALLTLCRLPNVDGWDEAFYVGQLVSLAGEGDLRLQDDVVQVPRRFEEKHRILTTTTSRGALLNTFGIGPALLVPPLAWPFLSASPPPPWGAFRAAAAVGAMAALGLTVLATCALARRFGIGGEVAPLAAGLAVLGGPLALYGTRFYLNAHLGAAALVAAALLLAREWTESPRWRTAAGLGLAAGLACVERGQDVTIVAPVALALALSARRSCEHRRSLLVAAAACLLGLGAQILAWWVQFGTPLLVPQGGGYLRWLEPQLVPFLLSGYHGLVPWAPGLALGLVGLAAGLRGAPPAERPLLVAMVAGAVLTVYVSASAEDWWGRDSYGPRRLTSLTPVAAVGLGFVLRRCATRTRLWGSQSRLRLGSATLTRCLASRRRSG